VARLDFNTLRQAIEALGPDDRESLLTRVANAEKKVSATAATPPAAEEPAPAGGRKRGSR
jgi:hypothetical protein